MLEVEEVGALKVFAGEVSFLLHWLHHNALPLWLKSGFDREMGGFFERVRLDGEPSRQDSRRARVQPRQVYCYAAAGLRNWPGAWQEVALEGFAWFEKVYLRGDGFYGSLASASGELIDDGFDLYNQAFALFAFVQLALGFPERKDEMEAKALALLSALRAGYAHPMGGFEEACPRKLPLCSNPHMHLFEASLAWEVAASDPAPWRALSDEIGNLAISRFINPESGALREFFDHDWKPFAGDKGRVVEPGHQFEWAWLLSRWGLSRGNPAAIAKARRLFEIGTKHGICETRQVAIMGLFDDFAIFDPVARLWPQTEWFKAAATLALMNSGHERTAYLLEAVRACNALRKFLATEMTGLWYDKLLPNGRFVAEPAPASSFYHILCSIYEAADMLERMR
ncbi:AGE family epimerase/isomerase [Sinorhizobium sp. BJ1]|uniref:AGE family epimerase/isomerase n=1 Tax=Sinorhizobium sp. BJ1 TaxID=2035455 RepID=UPI000BEA49F2|nr:AGE family epimerase/isomerase [Sinorhizobium sp. BJ1]PDT80356.1 mannose-6-phosphate isomerase [Sinorhizobium sp. BJ1]